jgi:hypothetical protein
VAYAVLPALQLGPDHADLVPDTVVTPDPAGMAGAALALLAAGLLVGWPARRPIARLDVTEELRQLG